MSFPINQTEHTIAGRKWVLDDRGRWRREQQLPPIPDSPDDIGAATAAQGTKADGSLQRSGGTLTGPLRNAVKDLGSFSSGTVKIDIREADVFQLRVSGSVEIDLDYLDDAGVTKVIQIEITGSGAALTIAGTYEWSDTEDHSTNFADTVPDPLISGKRYDFVAWVNNNQRMGTFG